MELLQLKYFQTVARLQHISKAAEELNVSQPSLSIMIARLEEELGAKLFDRVGRNIELNAAGQAFLTRIDAVFCELQSARDEVKEINGILSKRITIATTNSRLLFGILKNYLVNHDEVEIRQSYETSDKIEKLLHSGNIDFCLTTPPITGKEITCAVLKEDDIVLIVPKDHRLAHRTSIRLIEVAKDPFIALVQNYNYRGIMDMLCRSAGFVPNIAFEVDDALMSEMMSLGRGVALLPRYAIQPYQEMEADHVVLKIDEPVSRVQIGISWLKNRYLHATALGFRDYVIEHYNLASRAASL
jgi:LysR family transcriptional regulator, transcription activator of glutamate synthase operon